MKTIRWASKKHSNYELNLALRRAEAERLASLKYLQTFVSALTTLEMFRCEPRVEPSHLALQRAEPCPTFQH